MNSDIQVMKYAYEYARMNSTDPSTWNAAVLASSWGRIHVAAANCFPRNVQESSERWERPLKYKYVEHAERNVIYQAAYNGIRVHGLTMYCPWLTCTDCARAIIQAGIVEVVGHNLPIHASRIDWIENISIGRSMLYEAGITVRQIDDTLGLTSLFDGKLVEV